MSKTTYNPELPKFPAKFADRVKIVQVDEPPIEATAFDIIEDPYLPSVAAKSVEERWHFEHEKAPKRDFVRASELRKCVRYVFFDLTMAPMSNPPDGWLLNRLYTGTAMHEVIRDRLVASGVDLRGRERALNGLARYKITGHPDGSVFNYPKRDGLPTPYSLKTCFRLPHSAEQVREERFGDIWQEAIYMLDIDCGGVGALHYVQLTPHEERAFLITVTPELQEYLLRRNDAIYAYREANKVPARPYPYSDPECQRCWRRDFCWNGEDVQFDKDAPLVYKAWRGDWADLYRLTTERMIASRFMTQLEKEYDELTDALRLKMVECKASRVVIDSGTPGVQIVASLETRATKKLDKALLPPEMVAKATTVGTSSVLRTFLFDPATNKEIRKVKVDELPTPTPPKGRKAIPFKRKKLVEE